jgi:hypothetical protein
MWRPSKADLFLFPTTESLNASSFITHSDDRLKPNSHIVPCGISGVPGFRSGPEPGKSAMPPSVGEGVRGPCGPRTGNSSGLLPGNSSGRGGSPGSRRGGGTSGRGLPGGLSCGGSDGCPGLIGGSSCGSIGVSLMPNNGSATGMFLSSRRSPVAYCCGSCRSRRSPARACRRCSPPTIRSATSARSPPRAATALAALA